MRKSATKFLQRLCGASSIVSIGQKLLQILERPLVTYQSPLSSGLRKGCAKYFLKEVRKRGVSVKIQQKKCDSIGET